MYYFSLYSSWKIYTKTGDKGMLTLIRSKKMIHSKDLDHINVIIIEYTYIMIC